MFSPQRFPRLVVILCLLCVTIAAQASEIQEKVDVELVNVYLSATDSKGNFITDLNSSELTLSENGKTQEITHFTNFTKEGGAPLTVAYLVDISESMTEWLGGVKKIDIARRSSTQLLHSMRQQDRMTLITFDQEAHSLTGITSERVLVEAALDSVKAGKGGTALFDAMLFAAERIKSEWGRKLIVVCSDGNDNHSVNSMESVRKVLNANDVTVIAIGTQLRNRIFDPLANGRNTLRWFVERTSGYAYFPENKSGLEDVIQKVAGAVTRQYSLAYRPSADSAAWNKIELRCSRKGVKLNYRRGYGTVSAKAFAQVEELPEPVESPPGMAQVQVFPEESDQLAYEVEVSLAQVAIRITDKKGTPVTGISKDDLELYEDGKLQEIRYLDEMGSAQLGVAPQAEVQSLQEASLPRNGSTPPRNHILLVFDGANSGAASMKSQKEYLQKWIQDIDRQDVSFSVIQIKTAGNYEMLQSFTKQKDSLLQAIDGLQINGAGYENRLVRSLQLANSGGLTLCVSIQNAGMRGECLGSFARSLWYQARTLAREDRVRASATLNSMRELLIRIGHAPGRKNVIFISEGFDPAGYYYLNFAANLLESYSEHFGTGRVGSLDLQSEAAAGSSLLTAINELVHFANSCGISFYRVNPRLRRGPPDLFAETNVFVDDLKRVSAPDPVSIMVDLAEDTGGSASLSTKIGEVYDALLSDVLHYYLISYKPARAVFDEGTHRIEVRAKSKNSVVHYGKEFSDFSRDMRINNELAAAHDFPEISSAIPLKTEMTYVAMPDSKYRILVRAAISYSDLIPETRDETVGDEIHFSFVIRDDQGNVAEGVHPILTFQTSPGEFARLSQDGSLVEYTYTTLLDPADYSVSVAALDGAAWKTGSSSQLVHLPSPGDSCVTLAPLMIATSKAPDKIYAAQSRVAEDGKVLYSGNLYSFSLNRMFDSTGDLEGFYQIHYGKQRNGTQRCGSTIVFRLMNSAGEIIKQTGEGTISNCSDDKLGIVSNYFSIPYRGLAAGTYELEIDVRDAQGCSASSRAEFVIR